MNFVEKFPFADCRECKMCILDVRQEGTDTVIRCRNRKCTVIKHEDGTNRQDKVSGEQGR